MCIDEREAGKKRHVGGAKEGQGVVGCERGAEKDEEKREHRSRQECC